MTDYKLITPDVIPGATSWAGAAFHHEQPLCYGDPISAWFWLSAICHELVPEPEGPGWLCSDTERGVCIFSCLISSVQKHQNAWVSFFFSFLLCVIVKFTVWKLSGSTVRAKVAHIDQGSTFNCCSTWPLSALWRHHLPSQLRMPNWRRFSVNRGWNLNIDKLQGKKIITQYPLLGHGSTHHS